MALNSQKLIDGLKAAFKKGRETQTVSGGVDGEVETKYTRTDVAGFIADTIVDYASDAEVYLFPGPFLIPTGLIPDMANIFSAVKVRATDVGRPILQSGFASGFAIRDPTMFSATAAIVAYAATLTTFMGSPIPNTAMGVTTMVVPPIFAPVVAMGLAGRNEADCVHAMAAIIDTSFRSCIFNGAAITVLLGAGPVLGQPLI